MRNTRSKKIKAIIFDWGHTVMNELEYKRIPLRSRPVVVMPGLQEILSKIHFKKGIWANTNRTTSQEIKAWLKRAKLDQYFKWVFASADFGVRKPNKRFYDIALAKSKLTKNDILFVGNQLNTDILGANNYGITNVWLSGRTFKSPDDTLKRGDVKPTYEIRTLKQLPALINKITNKR